MTYVDVILPIPLHGMFTYAVPEGMTVQVGVRVLVTFGRSKSYVGLVGRVHTTKPEGYAVKPIQQVMDQTPIVTEQQLRLWHWISDCVCGTGLATITCRPLVRCTKRHCQQD